MNTASVSSDAYLHPPAVLCPPGPAYAASTRAFQGIPSLACGPDGRLFAVWYGGKTPGEDRNNYVMLVTSGDGGRTWSDEILVVDPDGEGPVRAYDPQVWLAPDGRCGCSARYAFAPPPCPAFDLVATSPPARRCASRRAALTA